MWDKKKESGHEIRADLPIQGVGDKCVPELEDYFDKHMLPE